MRFIIVAQYLFVIDVVGLVNGGGICLICEIVITVNGNES